MQAVVSNAQSSGEGDLRLLGLVMSARLSRVGAVEAMNREARRLFGDEFREGGGLRLRDTRD